MDGPTRRALNIGVARVNAEGRCVYVSEHFAKILGFTREEILGHAWTRLPDVGPRVPERWDELRAGRSVVSIDTYERPDGRRVEVQIESTPEVDADGRVTSVLLTCADVTAQEHAEAESVRERERAAARLEELAQLYENAPVALCVVDRDLRYVRANEQYGRLIGRSADTLIGRTLMEVLRSPVREGAIDAARKVFESSDPLLDLEFRVGGCEHGLERSWLVNVHPVRRDGEVSGVMVVLQEVTSVRRAEQDARQRLNELESVYRNAPVGLAFIDHDLRYLRVNRALADMNGLPIDEVVGRRYRDLAPESADLAEPFLRAVTKSGRSVRNLEVHARPPGDPQTEHVYLVSMDPVRAADGDLIGHVSAVQDVTELRRAQETAAQRLEELETLYAHTPVGLCYLDSELRVVHLNPLFAQLSDRPLEEQIGVSAPELLPDAIARQLVPQLRHVARTGTASVGLEVRGRPPGSTRDYVWIANAHPAKSGDGAVSGIVAVLQDVTALAKRQRETEMAHDRLAEAQHVARVGSWEWDLLGDTFWWSRELHAILGERPGYRPSFTRFFEHVHPLDRPKVRKQIERTLLDDEPYRMTFRIQRADGSERVLFTAVRLERAEGGVPARLVGTCQDVTEIEPTHRRPSRRRGR